MICLKLFFLAFFVNILLLKMKKQISFLSAIFLVYTINAQINFNRDTTIAVIENGVNFKQTWVGGINAAQPSEIDLNLDGTRDLIIFDRTGNKLTPFLDVNGEYIFAPEYSTWALEIHYINFLLHEKDTPSYNDIKAIAHAYVSNNKPLRLNFSEDFLKKYEDLCMDVLEGYRNGVWEIIDIIAKSWETWDNYSLSIMYLRIIYYLNISFVHKKPVKSFVANDFTVDFTELLLMNIHPNPKFRYNVKETKQRFDDFFYDKNINNVSNFQQILSQFESGKDNLEQIVSEDKYQMQKLLKKMGTRRSKSVA